MVGEGAHGGQGGALLPAALGGGGDEDADVLAVEAARLPLLARVVEEGLPLGGEVAEAGRDPQEEGVVLLQLVRGDEGDGGRLRRGVHFRKDFLGQGLFDSIREEKRQVNFLGGAFLPVRSQKEGKKGGRGQIFGNDSVWRKLDRGNPLVEVGLASGCLDTGFLGFGKLGNVAIHGVLYQWSQQFVWMQL